jgi:hypothetical protein
LLPLALIYAVAPATARGAASSPSDGVLSPRLAELNKPSVRSTPPAEQAEDLSLAAAGPGSLLREGNRVLVEVRFDRGAAAAVGDLRATGAKVVNVSRRFQTVTVAAKPSELSRLSGVPLASAATEVLTPFTSTSTCPSGEVVSEGDLQLHAKEARETPSELDGSGVTVGILSDSFNQATEAADGSGEIATRQAADVAEGDLPGFANTCAGEQTPVEILDDTDSAGKDEGRAMAQIVHDLAPGADLAFATAFAGEAAFAENIEALAKSPAEGGAGAKVVVDDVAYPGEPFFQEGPIAVAVQHATEDGATYFSSAGNNSLLDASGHQIGSWETAKYRSSGSCPPALQAFPALHANACLDFNPDPAEGQTDKTLGIKVPAGATLTVDLQWSEPWNAVGTDLDAFLLDSTGGLIAASAEPNPERPLEFFQWKNGSTGQRTVQLVVNRFSGGLPRLKVAFLENGAKEKQWGLEYPQSSGSAKNGPATDVVGPTVFGHNGAAAAITVGAVHRPPAAVAEPYTSRGPVTHYFGPVKDSEEPALPISPEELAKPEIAATDCGKTSFFAFFESPAWRFCGTSAAAPHAAAVAALMDEAKEEEPPNEPAEPAEIRAALLSSAVGVTGADECEVGTGLVEAVGAIEDLLTPPAAAEPECEAPLAEVTVSNAQAAGNWGAESPPAPPSPPSGETTQPPSPPEPETDTTPPATFFHRRPQRVIRTHARTATAMFELGSNEAGAIYFCRVDTGATKRCPALFRRRYRIGPHTIRVWARDPSGNTDQSAAVFHFRVKRIG